jgi:drug/metabolite transporter (DMT)-like permease
MGRKDMTLYQLGLCLICVLGISSGQVLFKLAANSLVKPHSVLETIMIVFNPYLFSALVLYGSITFLWVYTLKVTPLPLAYPIQALAFIIVPVLNYFFIGEAIASRTILGAAVIFLGICISVW